LALLGNKTGAPRFGCAVLLKFFQAALCWSRQSEVTDAQVELLIGLVHKINAHVGKKVERELPVELLKVRGKEGILF
jgi:hypothetical protein